MVNNGKGEEEEKGNRVVSNMNIIIEQMKFNCIPSAILRVFKAQTTDRDDNEGKELNPITTNSINYSTLTLRQPISECLCPSNPLP